MQDTGILPTATATPAPQATGDTVLSAHGLGFRYGQRTPIFEDIHLDIAEREIVCLLGSSGCGKSTLLKVLAGLSAPTTGETTFLGTPLQSPHPRSALVFQQASLLPWLNVFDNVRFGLNFSHQPVITRAAEQERVLRAIAAVGLQGQERAYPAALSGGMAQRVAIARALARQPKLLFADEPFSALDAITRMEMQTLLVQLVRQWDTAVLLVTHDIDEAIAMGDRIILMHGAPGRISHEWRVDIPHPRDMHPQAVPALRAEILTALRDTRLPHP